MSSERMTRNISALLRASNYFDLLKLQRPYEDLMGDPLWDVTADQVSRAYRKLSLCCHPDKSDHPDAPRAFELLKKAKKTLTDPLEMDDYLRNFLKECATQWQGNWVTASSSAGGGRERVASMRREAQLEQEDSVRDAMRERHERASAAARRAERIRAAQALGGGKYRARKESGRAGGAAERGGSPKLPSESDGSEDEAPPPARAPAAASSSVVRPAARKRPKFF